MTIMLASILFMVTFATAEDAAVTPPIDPLTHIRTDGDPDKVFINFEGWGGMTAETIINIVESAPEDILTRQQKEALLKYPKRIDIQTPSGWKKSEGGVTSYELIFEVERSAPVEELNQAFMKAYAAWLEKEGDQFAKEQFEAAKARPEKELAATKVALEQFRKDGALLYLMNDSGAVGGVSETMLDQLRIERLVLKADIAGVQAKLAAANRLLSKVAEGERHQIDALIATAELELADYLAKQDALETMYAAAKRLKEDIYKNQSDSLQASYNSLNEWKLAMENNIKPSVDIKAR